MIPTFIYYYMSLALVFFILGTFMIIKSSRNKVFNITWAGIVIVSYSFYFVGTMLNYFGLIIGIWNLILQVFYYGIQFLTLIFTMETFYKYKAKRFLGAIACIVLVLGITCSTFSILGDTGLHYIDINDVFDAWRFFLSNIITIPITCTPLLLATRHEFKIARPKEPELSHRFLLYFTSVLTSIASSVLIEFGITFNSLYDVLSVLVLCTGVYSTIALYLTWISPEKGKHYDFVVDTSKTLKIGDMPIPETIITSIATFRVIEDLGITLSKITGQSINACNGLLLLLIEKELGFDSLHRLDLAKLVPLFDGPLLQYLTQLKIESPSTAVTMLKSRLSERYAAFSMNLF